MYKTVRNRLAYYQALASDPCTPALSKWLIVVATTYLVSPIDIIPDFIPILSHVDDLIIVSGLIYIAVHLIPEDVKLRARSKRSSI